MTRRDRRTPWLYRALLRLYPRAFREDLGSAMAETFAEELADARRRGPAAVASLWVRTLVRTPFLAAEERLRRPRGRTDGLGSWFVDVRSAVRSLIRAPGFSIAAILTVSLGVAATASLFSVVDTVLLRPLPVDRPDRLVRVQEDRSRHLSVGMEGPRMPFARYREIRAATDGVFSGVAAHNFRYVSMRGDGPAFPVAGVLASGNYFEVLGVRPAVGGFFSRDDETAAVLSYGVWQARFGGSSEVVGRTIHVNGEPFTVAGVAPRGFGGTVGFLYPDVWVPHGAHDGAAWSGARVTLFARLAPDIDVETAAEVAGAVAVRLPPQDDPEAEVRGVRLEPLSPLPSSLSGPALGFLGMLFATALLVLVIAAANVGGVLAARTTGRRRELAVRRALGAGRGHLVRQLTLEAVGLFVLGGAVGALGAGIGIRLLAGIRLPIAEAARIDATLDLRVVGVALGAAVTTGLIFGLLPALQASRSDLADALRDGGWWASSGGSRLRQLFVSAQIALSVVLLVGAGLFVRTVHRAVTADPGFEPEGVVVATVELDPRRYDVQTGRAFYERLMARVRALPEVESAALAQVALLTGESETSGWRTGPDEPVVIAGQNVVDGAWFETMRVRLTAGRTIDEIDRPDAPLAAVVNETFARRIGRDPNPVGRVLLRDDRRYRVVGVVGDGAYVTFGEEASPFVFLSSAQHFGGQRVVHVRPRPEVAAGEVIRSLRSTVAALDPDVAVRQAMPLSTAIGALLLPQRFAAMLIGLFGFLGLVLACVGVYGVLAHQVARRTRELGIRIALGAGTRTVLAVVARRAAVLALGGLVVGLAVAAVLSRFLRSFLYDVSPLDTTTFLAAPLALGVVAFLAGVLPARRALRVDPVEALRRE